MLLLANFRSCQPAPSGAIYVYSLVELSAIARGCSQNCFPPPSCYYVTAATTVKVNQFRNLNITMSARG